MRGERVAADLQLVFGPLPHNEMPLKSNITGSYKAEGYTVYKVYFESRPQFFVTGGLFVPDNAVKSKTPGILFASGHTPQAWRSTNENSEDGYQLVISNLAKKGLWPLDQLLLLVCLVDIHFQLENCDPRCSRKFNKNRGKK
jgi:hypothetical protein